VSFLENKRRLVAGDIAVNSEAFENLSTLCESFGSRFSATPEEKAAADYLAIKLTEYGLHNVHVESFDQFGWVCGEMTKLWNWKRGSASFDLVDPLPIMIPCYSLPNSPSTPEEGIQAEIFNLESGSRAYLLEHRDELIGKIILDGNYMPPDTYHASRDPTNLYRPTIYGYLAEFGATAMIFSNRFYGNLPSTGSASLGSIGKMPACGISRESSQMILRQLEKGPVIANLKIMNTYAPNAVSHNVIADIPGTEHPNQVILVGGHYDGHDVSVGAMDNAAGACVVLEATRALAKYGGSPKRTIRFCFFGSEEVGLNGSTNYVLQHADELKDMVLMINTDGAGRSTQMGHGFNVHGPESLVSYLEQVIDQLGNFDREKELPKVTYSVRPYSDHFPFYMWGVPTAQIHNIPVDPVTEQYGHTSADTVDKVPPKAMKDSALILAITLLQIANEDTVPIQHTPLETVIQTLEDNEIAENLRIERRWLREIPEELIPEGRKS